MLAEIPLGGNIAAEKRIGNTHVYICDAAYLKNKTPDGRQRVLDQAAQASLDIILHSQRSRV
jgi:hypothetical protein